MVTIFTILKRKGHTLWCPFRSRYSQEQNNKKEQNNQKEQKNYIRTKKKEHKEQVRYVPCSSSHYCMAVAKMANDPVCAKLNFGTYSVQQGDATAPLSVRQTTEKMCATTKKNTQTSSTLHEETACNT